MQLITRKQYLNELIELYGTPDIKVITGIRRCGKSVLLSEFVSYLQSLDKAINIVMIKLLPFTNSFNPVSKLRSK